MSLPKLGTKAVKGMLIHHATTRLGWTREEISEAFDEWYGDCVAHRERVEPNFTYAPGGSTPTAPTEPSDTGAELIGDVEYDSIRDEWRASPTEQG